MTISTTYATCATLRKHCRLCLTVYINVIYAKLRSKTMLIKSIMMIVMMMLLLLVNKTAIMASRRLQSVKKCHWLGSSPIDSSKWFLTLTLHDSCVIWRHGCVVVCIICTMNQLVYLSVFTRNWWGQSRCSTKISCPLLPHHSHQARPLPTHRERNKTVIINCIKVTWHDRQVWVLLKI